MLSLFMKDVRAGATLLWAVLPLYVLAGLQVVGHGRGLYWGSIVCGIVLVVGACVIDWKNGADPFVHSLPVTRADVVRGRYLTAMAAGALSLVSGAALGTIGALILGARGEAWPRWAGPDVALAFIPAFAFVVAVYLPCHFRWGFGRGNVAAALFLAAAVLVAGVADPFVPAALAGTGTALTEAGLPRGLIPRTVAVMAGRWGLALTSLAVIGASAFVLWSSSQVAVCAARRREY